MLAIKSVIADTEQIPILVFDEIDTGISGRIAGRVGLAMKELSKTHQIIAITHLAQIAVQGDNIISVIKKEDGERTEITARNEDEETKIKEIAKLISANEVTDISIKNIHELMQMNFQE
jgi:DNA repair protein RecN (Recombination protein N)